MPLWSFQGARELARNEMPALAGLSKLNSVERRGRRDFQATWCTGRRRSTINGPGTYRSNRSGFPRKEVIQPQLPLRLPCYDFAPVIDPTLGACLLAVSPATSGVTDSHSVTGGVYKARERIHRRVLTGGY